MNADELSPRKPIRQFTWAIKTSKLCNLRCKYCYEWSHLADPARIPPAGWERILAVAREYHLRQTTGQTVEGETRLLWHGGEPLCLPIEYWTDVIRRQRQVFGAPPSITCRNLVQTNLFDLSTEHLELMAGERFWVNVSFDGEAHTRVTAAGSSTNDRVFNNLQRLRQRRIGFGIAIVLGGHSRHRLIETYERVKAAGAEQVTVIPLLPADHFTNDAPFAISSTEVVDALAMLYLHWADDPSPIPIAPLAEYRRTALLHLLNLPRHDHHRATDGEKRFLIETSGDVYVRSVHYALQRRLGNVFTHDVTDLIASPAYAESLRQDERRRAEVCNGCEYRSACDTRPALESTGVGDDGRCPVAPALCAFIAAHHARRALDPDVHWALPTEA